MSQYGFVKMSAVEMLIKCYARNIVAAAVATRLLMENKNVCREERMLDAQNANRRAPAQSSRYSMSYNANRWRLQRARGRRAARRDVGRDVAYIVNDHAGTAPKREENEGKRGGGNAVVSTQAKMRMRKTQRAVGGRYARLRRKWHKRRGSGASAARANHGRVGGDALSLPGAREPAIQNQIS